MKSKERIKEETTIIMTKGTTKGFRPDYIDIICIDIICLVILLVVFFVALFLTHGVWFIVDLLLLAGTGTILGRTVGKMVNV